MMKKIINILISMIVGGVIGASLIGKFCLKRKRSLEEKSNKHLVMFKLMNQWVSNNQRGKSLVSYFERNNYKKIAVYGMNYIGNTFIEELKKSPITVEYGIDKNTNISHPDIKIVAPDDITEDVDAIIVTSITFFDEIYDVLEAKVSCPIISLEDIVYGIE